MDIIYWNHYILTSIDLVISRKHISDFSSSYQNLQQMRNADTRKKISSQKKIVLWFSQLEGCRVAPTGGWGYRRMDSFMQRVKNLRSFISSYEGDLPCKTLSTSSCAFIREEEFCMKTFVNNRQLIHSPFQLNQSPALHFSEMSLT